MREPEESKHVNLQTNWSCNPSWRGKQLFQVGKHFHSRDSQRRSSLEEDLKKLMQSTKASLDEMVKN